MSGHPKRNGNDLVGAYCESSIGPVCGHRWVPLTGSFGIVEVRTGTGNCKCGECGREWLEDITPAGRCPFEAEHA